MRFCFFMRVSKMPLTHLVLFPFFDSLIFRACDDTSRTGLQ